MTKRVLRPVLYSLLLILFTVVFTALNFPQDRVSAYVDEWIKSRAGDRITAETARVGLPLSLHVSKIQLDSEGRKIPLGDLVIKPGIVSLFRSEKSLSALLKGSWGSLPFSLEMGRENWVLDLKGNDIDLSRLPAVETMPVNLEGVLAIQAHLDGSSQDQAEWAGNGSIHLTDVRLSGNLLDMVGVGILNLSDVRLPWSARENLVTLKETDVAGDIMGKAAGTILVNPGSVENSRLSLTLDLRPSLEARDRIGPLLSLLGSNSGPENGVSVKVRGTLGQPKLSL
ncbi:MAG: type II secretion system protein GspN [bacterium]|nr:MAG: type II secretion system protein GspN [bacterium]